MKKLVLLAMSAMMIAFAGCNQNTPVPGADKDISGINGKIDPEKSTTVTVYFPTRFVYSGEIYYRSDNKVVLDSICIYNDKGVKVGISGYVGDYLVPYNGFIQLTYHGEYKGSKSQCKTDIYEVGTAKQMYIAIYACCHWNSSTSSYYWDKPFSVVTDGKE